MFSDKWTIGHLDVERSRTVPKGSRRDPFLIPEGVQRILK
jgi:hypothetical protein